MASPLAQDFFTLFGLPRAYHIDENQLKVRYRELQQIVHPDRYAAAPSQQRRHAVQLAAHINEAFETLGHPLRRLGYLLELSGISCGEGGGSQLSTEFLAEQMEWREELDALTTATTPVRDIETFLKRIDVRLDALEAEVGQALLRTGDDTPPRAVVCYREMQFLHRLREEVAAVAERLDI